MEPKNNIVASPETFNFELVWKSLGKKLIKRIIIFSFLFVTLCLVLSFFENGKNIFDNLFQKIFLFSVLFGLFKIGKFLNKKPKLSK